MQDDAAISMRHRPPPGADGWLDGRRDAALAKLSRSAILWIDGPPGAGKTVLAVTLLRARPGKRIWLRLAAEDHDPHHLLEDVIMALHGTGTGPGGSAHAGSLTHPGEEIAALLAPHAPYTLVLDGADVLGECTGFHRLIGHLATACPADSAVVITARMPPPPSLERLRMEGLVERVLWNDLRLSSDEAAGAAGAILPPEELNPETVADALHRSRGWLAGFRALLEAEAGNCGTLGSLNRYLEHELLSDLERADRELLVTLAVREEVPRPVVEALAGPGACDRLHDLARQNRLIEWRGDHVVLHPQLAVCLRDLDREGLARRHCRLGDALAAAGAEAQAVEQWLSAGDWSRSGEVITRLAPELVRKGEHPRVRDWLRRIPESSRPAGSRLHLWHALALIPEDAAAAYDELVAALPALRGNGDYSGAALAWAGLVEQAWLRWGDFSRVRWLLDVLDELGPQRIEELEPSAAAQLSAAALLLIGVIAPGGHRGAAWIGAAERVVRLSISDMERMRILHVLLVTDVWVYGNRIRATRTVEQGRIAQVRGRLPPLQEQMWLAAVAGYQLWFDPDPHAARLTVESALRRAEEHGVHLWDFQLQALGACAALRSGDDRLARDWVARTRLTTEPGQATDASFQAWVCGWTLLRGGDVAGAAGIAEEAWQLIDGRGPDNAQLLARLAVARARRRLGQHRTTLAEAIAIDRMARRRDMGLYRWLARLTAAQALRDCGRHRWSDRLLEQALVEGQSQGYLCIPWCERGELEDLCGRGVALGVDTRYLCRLARTNGLDDWQPPPHAPATGWPLRLQALGVLRVEGATGTIRIVGKGARLLRWLAAAGENGIAEADVLDALWPDAEGDRARRAFDTLLYRLRRRLRIPDAVQLRDRHLTLNTAACRTDFGALEHHLKAAMNGSLTAWEDALELAQDSGVEAAHWPPPAGPRLRRRFHDAVDTMVHRLADEQGQDAACAAASRALEIDPLHEPLCRIVLELARARRDRELAEQAYDRCRHALAREGKGEPTEKLRTLYEAIRQAVC